MQHYFKGDDLFDDFGILFGENHMWIVRIRRLWDINHYILDFYHVSNDLCLITSDLISLTPDLVLPVVEVVKNDDEGFILDRYAIGLVVITNDEGNEWIVIVMSTAAGYCFSNGWLAVVRDIVVDDKDIIVFQVLDAQTLKMTHFEANHLSGVNNKFCLEMLFPENRNFWLPKNFMNRYFKGDTLELELQFILERYICGVLK
ncbi:putative transcription factor B3-Domain family [Helianthus anomalus]